MQCAARFDWHATREYLCTRSLAEFVYRTRGFSVLPASFRIREGCLFADSARWDFSSHPGTEREETGRKKKRTRDNDDERREEGGERNVWVGMIALPEVSAVLSYEYFYINPRCIYTHSVRGDCTLSGQRSDFGGVS